MTDPDSIDLLVMATLLFGIGFATAIIPTIAPFSITVMIIILVIAASKMHKNHKSMGNNMLEKILKPLKFIMMLISGIILFFSVLMCMKLMTNKTNATILKKYTMPTKKVELHDASYKPRISDDGEEFNTKIKDGYILTASSKDNEEYTIFMPVKPNIDKSQRIYLFVKFDNANLSNEPYYAFENKKDFENSKQEITTIQNYTKKYYVISIILFIFSIVALVLLMNIHI